MLCSLLFFLCQGQKDTTNSKFESIFGYPDVIDKDSIQETVITSTMLIGHWCFQEKGTAKDKIKGGSIGDLIFSADRTLNRSLNENKRNIYWDFSRKDTLSLYAAFDQGLLSAYPIQFKIIKLNQRKLVIEIIGASNQLGKKETYTFRRKKTRA